MKDEGRKEGRIGKKEREVEGQEKRIERAKGIEKEGKTDGRKKGIKRSKRERERGKKERKTKRIGKGN